jgi:hypothetical protein
MKKDARDYAKDLAEGGLKVEMQSSRGSK